MYITEIKQGIHYVGVNDRTKHRFEGLWSLPYGVSYNSYLLLGDKVALMDTVEESFGSRFLQNIERELDGRTIYANVQERGLKSKEEAKLEVHDKYIDIQILLSGAEESFGWADRSTLREPKEAFNAEKDIQFFLDAPQTYYTLRPGQFTILLPEDAHAPLVGEGTIRKVILKVLK